MKLKRILIALKFGANQIENEVKMNTMKIRGVHLILSSNFSSHKNDKTRSERAAGLIQLTLAF